MRLISILLAAGLCLAVYGATAPDPYAAADLVRDGIHKLVAAVRPFVFA